MSLYRYEILVFPRPERRRCRIVSGRQIFNEIQFVSYQGYSGLVVMADDERPARLGHDADAEIVLSALQHSPVEHVAKTEMMAEVRNEVLGFHRSFALALTTVSANSSNTAAGSSRKRYDEDVPPQHHLVGLVKGRPGLTA